MTLQLVRDVVQMQPPGKACRGVVSSLALQIGALPQIRRMVCEFNDRQKYPERPMITLLKGEPSVYLLGWREGDFTEIHDHGDCEVGLYVIQGTVVEDLFATVCLPGSRDRDCTLEISRFLRQGDLAVCPRTYMHRVGNLFPETAATLHVYGPALTEMQLFELVAGRLTFKGCWGCDDKPQH